MKMVNALNRLFQITKELYRRLFVILPNRRRLKNHDFTLIANNCVGGVICHDLGEPFNGPTVNLFFPLEDYRLFLDNLEEALSANLEEYFPENETPTYPLGRLYLKSGDVIRIHFVHYKTFLDAKTKWDERRKRVKWDNLFILMEAGVETTQELVRWFDALPFSNKIILTNKSYPYASARFLSIYDDAYSWGKLIKTKPRTFKTKRYVDDLDYIAWLNRQLPL